MLIELDKIDLANMVRGTYPPYSQLDSPLVAKCGTYCGGHSDQWTWNYRFEDNLTEEQLYKLYQICKS